ncbi:PEF-CTERM sorting domain-containing protein [Methanolobus sp.]|uniref:PEF-CTERM sorting domain-containing protein n=1 Tax=Methanolobus sp. TaxID=1874737 RepID=UPI0025CBF7F5|nr:PEF-CTERM sorting domain-containing protein [Methanolobus sp.]
MKKIISLLFIAIIAMAGTAYAYDANIWNAAGTAAVTNPIVLQPGQTQIFSYHGANFAAPNQVMPYSYNVQALPGTGADPSDMTVVISKANFEPGIEDPYTDVGVISISLSEDAPATGKWRVTVTAGEDTNTLDVGSAARNFEIPEFPTIALPVAAILGLAFFMQRRKEE